MCQKSSGNTRWQCVRRYGFCSLLLEPLFKNTDIHPRRSPTTISKAKKRPCNVFSRVEVHMYLKNGHKNFEIQLRPFKQDSNESQSHIPSVNVAVLKLLSAFHENNKHVIESDRKKCLIGVEYTVLLQRVSSFQNVDSTFSNSSLVDESGGMSFQFFRICASEEEAPGGR